LTLTAGLGAGLAVALRGGGGSPAQGGDVVGPTREIFIPSVSMEPTLKVGDTVLVDEGAYRGAGGLPMPGDIIAFDASDPTQTTFVKRVVGLPGDVVEEHAGTILVNGDPFPMPEPEARDHQTLGPWTVEPGHVFVVGDNVGNSNDSRFPLIGQVPLDRIIGKVVEILSPGDRRATVGPPPAEVATGPGEARSSAG
jgi:signal peptidase I